MLRWELRVPDSGGFIGTALKGSTGLMAPWFAALLGGVAQGSCSVTSLASWPSIVIPVSHQRQERGCGPRGRARVDHEE